MLTIRAAQDRVSQVYYTYGLFCASHPWITIIWVIVTVLITCYPLSNLPLPGNTLIEHRSLRLGYAVPDGSTGADGIQDEQKRPRWFYGEPVAYVQQVVVKSAVSPWVAQQMKASDAFRGPLMSAFKVLEDLDHFKMTIGDKELSLADVCYRVSEPINAHHLHKLLPDYSCFVVSPANFWQQDLSRFKKDPDIISTVYRKYGQVVESPPTTKDLLFGTPWKDTGITRYYIRNRQRVVTYAVTIIMKKYEPKFISALRSWLEQRHPETSANVNNSQVEDLVHIHFKDVNYIIEYTPLLVTYLALLLYLYFSVRKIEMVKSKFGLAISAVMTVLASLMMSVSICSLFGMRPTLNRGEIFPYLVVIVGVENVLVITKSVVSTPVHLDVKIRVAQGLSREGWSITKNLLSELAIVFVGLFTFVPAIQEFCAFALVGVMTDFYLQIAFFATVLSVDIRRMELSDLHRQSVQQAVEDESTSTLVNIEPLILCPFAPRYEKSPVSKNPPANLKDSSPGFTNMSPTPGSGNMGPSSGQVLNARQQLERPRYEMPRRIKFFYFLARFRIVQKLIMVCTVIWIILILYKAGLVERLSWNQQSHNTPRPMVVRPVDGDSMLNLIRNEQDLAGMSASIGRVEHQQEVGLVTHRELELWRKLSHKHWPTLFHSFNISLSGRYISILPTIHLSEIVDPQTAIDLRCPSDRPPEAYTSPFSDHEDVHSDSDPQDTGDLPNSSHQFETFYPKSQQEYAITVVFCFLSVIVITYFMCVLYRCMCSRNYSRWRRSWHRKSRTRVRGNYVKQIKESVPIVLSGHTQNIECLLGDNGLVVSCCLGGQLKVWNSNSWECINTILRNRELPASRRRPCVGRNIEDSDADLYAEYHGGSESRSSSETSLLESSTGLEGDGLRVRKVDHFSFEMTGRRRRVGHRRRFSRNYSDLMPDLSSTINTEFSSISSRLHSTSPSNGYDFRGWFEGIYEEHRRFLADSEDQSQHLQVDASDPSLLAAERSRSWSYGDQSALEGLATDEETHVSQPSSIWCLATLHSLIVAGCGNGQIEVWDAETGELGYHYGVSDVGVTGLCVVANKIVAARLDGSLDFLEMETFQNPVLNQSLITAHSPQLDRGYSHHYSTGSVQTAKFWQEILRCTNVTTYRAHQLPISDVQCAGGRVVTASQDHTLKVFRLENALCLYTMHGHEGGVTALCLDKVAPFSAVSGSVDGTIRIWDLFTGSCVHVFDWHLAAVATLTISSLYIVSVGLDDRMCVWDRSKSTLLHKIDLDACGVGGASLMSQNHMVTGGQGSISLWDIARGTLLRKVEFSDGDKNVYVHHIVRVANNGIVCDQGQDLKVVFFPTILEKAE